MFGELLTNPANDFENWPEVRTRVSEARLDMKGDFDGALSNA